MTKNTRIAAALAAVSMVALTLGGCSSLTEPFNDAPVADKDDSPAVIYSFPDGFGNVASKCDRQGNRIFVTRVNDAASSVDVVANDPSCKR